MTTKERERVDDLYRLLNTLGHSKYTNAIDLVVRELLFLHGFEIDEVAETTVAETTKAPTSSD